MKIDIVIDFYKKHKTWPMVLWGLEQNREYINRVHIVNDELWNGTKPNTGSMDVVFHEHKHDGFGAHKSIRQGAACVGTEFFAHIDSDVVLAPKSIEYNLELVSDEEIVYGTSHDIARDITLDAFPNPPIERYDWRIDKPHFADYPNMRDLYWIMRTKDYFSIGGHDLEYKSYGFVDYDFGIRWMLEYGRDAYVIGPGVGYHIGGKDRPEDKIGKEPSEANHKRFAAVEQRFIKRYNAGTV